MTRLTRSPCCGPGQCSRGGWVNTTISPARTSCQLKNAFWTRIRSYTLSVGTMDDEGIQKVWNTYARTTKASSTATRMMMAVSASDRVLRRRRWLTLAGPASAGPTSAGSAAAGPASAGPAMPAYPDDHLRSARGRDHAQYRLRRARPAACAWVRLARAGRPGWPRRGQQPRRHAQRTSRDEQRAGHRARAPTGTWRQPLPRCTGQVAPGNRARRGPVPDEQRGQFGGLVAVPLAPAEWVAPQHGPDQPGCPGSIHQMPPT